jgi:ribosomal protein S18 acetylase RimI-like enzyme
MLKDHRDIEIKFVDYWPNDQIVKLYKAGGWWKESYDTSGIESLIKGSFLFAVIVEKNSGKAIGMGRILSDGVSDAYIQDLVVLPEYRSQGIGKRLVEFLLNHCLSKGIKWIGLIAEPGQDSFYSSMNFHLMKDHIPMKYKIED